MGIACRWGHPLISTDSSSALNVTIAHRPHVLPLSPMERILRGFLLLYAVILTAVLGYHLLFGMGWLGSLWLTVVTITGVGYGEEPTKPPTFQLFTIFVILFGFFAMAYAFTGLIQLLLEGEFERFVGKRKMEREIKKLKNHVIVCGFGRLGHNVATDLAHENRDFVIIDDDERQVQSARSEGYLAMLGDATEEDILVTAGLRSASSLVTALPSDAANVFITLTGRNLNPSVQIIARAEHKSTEGKLAQAGASKIVMPASTSARHMVRMITRPSTAHLMDLMGEKSFLDVELDEVRIPPENKLVGMRVSESNAHYEHKLLVVAVKKHHDDSMVFNPGGAYVFEADDIAILMGKRNDIVGFRKNYSLRA